MQILAGIIPALAAFAALALVALLGFRENLWLVIAALARHGVFDARQVRLITNPVLPVWLALLWLGCDVAANAYLTWRVKKMAVSAAPRRLSLEAVRA